MKRRGMAWFDFLWTDINIDKLDQHELSQNDFIHVVCHPSYRGRSHTGRPAAWDYEMIDEVTVLPITAFEVKER